MKATDKLIAAIDKKLERFDPLWQAEHGTGGQRSRYYDKTGVAKWSDLKVAVQYRVTETKAPAGYTLLTEPLFTGTLDSSNRDVTITACNNAGFVLPFTGSTGFTTYFLFAALAAFAGVYFCKKSARRKTAG